MDINVNINEHFKDFVLDEKHNIYFELGGYGSSKSYNTAFKTVLLSLQEKRKILVTRQVKDTLKESCFADIVEIINDLGLDDFFKINKSPMEIICRRNGSKFIFKGLDKAKKIKSIRDIDTIWIEEADEIDYKTFKELKSRLRTQKNRNILIITTNPNELDTWTYKWLTETLSKVEMDINDLYNKRIIKIEDITKLESGDVNIENIYLHHSNYKDNKFLDKNFIAELENEKDDFQRAIKKLGHFGSSGEKILNNIVQLNQEQIMLAVKNLYNLYTGFDFGFAKSYNAIVRLAIDEENNNLYIYDEFYGKEITDTEMLEMDIIKQLIAEGEVVYADSAEPKTIRFYKMNNLSISGAKKTPDISKAGVKKLQNFDNIFIDPVKCPNTYRELTMMKWHLNKDGIIAKNPKTNKPFNIDAHTFDAIKYGLNKYTPYIFDKHHYKREEE